MGCSFLFVIALFGAALGANINLKTTSGASTKIEWDGTVLTVPQRELLARVVRDPMPST